MSNKNLQLLIPLLLCMVFSHAQQRYELSVKEAVDLAYKNVVELKNAQLDYKIQEAVNKQIVGQALPQVSGNVGLQRYIKLPTILFPQSDESVYQVLRRENLVPQSTQAPPPSLLAFSFQQPWNFTAGATVQQLLFQPDVFVGLQARQASLDYNNALIEQSKEKIKDSAYKRYYAILITQKQLSLIDTSLIRLRKMYHDDSIMYKNGFAERLDLDKVQVQINNLTSTRRTVESALAISYAAMKFAMGVSQKDTVVLKDSLSVEELRSDLITTDFKYEDRAEVRTINQLQKLQALDVRRYQLGYLPTVALAGNYGVTGMGQKFITDKSTYWFKSAYLGLNVNIPIFDGFQRRYKVSEAQLKLQKLDNTLDLAKQGIDFEQQAARSILINALTDLELQQQNLALAQRVYNGTNLKFQQGLGSSFEVLQADTDLQQALGNYFNALYNATTARVSYLYSLGKL